VAIALPALESQQSERQLKTFQVRALDASLAKNLLHPLGRVFSPFLHVHDHVCVPGAQLRR
jgi:hypothetical protein